VSLVLDERRHRTRTPMAGGTPDPIVYLIKTTY
jgi:hypothetical protein